MINIIIRCIDISYGCSYNLLYAVAAHATQHIDWNCYKCHTCSKWYKFFTINRR